MFFEQSHYKFTLNQTGDTSRVLGRGFWEPIAVKSHHVSFLALWKLPAEVHSKSTLVSALNRDTQRPTQQPPCNTYSNDTDSPVCVLWDDLTQSKGAFTLATFV